MRRALLTGATGFVGGHLVEHLAHAGWTLTIAGRDPAAISTRWPHAKAVAFDLDCPGALSLQALEDVDCIYHLAAKVHVMRPGPGDEEEFVARNALATEILARSAAAAGVRRFVYLSSIKVNGEATRTRPFTADDVPAPADGYARSKCEAEALLQRVSASTGLEVVILRPPLIYGAGVGANFLRLIKLVDSDLPLPIGSLRNRRSMIGVWNLASALELVGTHPAACNRTWLVSDGQDVAVADLMREMAEVLGKRLRVWRVAPSMLRAVAFALGRSGEMRRVTDALEVDSTPVRSELGWIAPVSLRDGIARTVEWYRRNVPAN